MAYDPITLDAAAAYIRGHLIPEEISSPGISVWVTNTCWEKGTEEAVPEVTVLYNETCTHAAWRACQILESIIAKDKSRLWYRRVNTIPNINFRLLLCPTRQIKTYDPSYNFLFGERKCIWSYQSYDHVIAHVIPHIFSPLQDSPSWQTLEEIEMLGDNESRWRRFKQEHPLLDYLKAFPSLDAMRTWANSLLAWGEWQTHIAKNTEPYMPWSKDWLILPSIVACNFNLPNKSAYVRLEPNQAWQTDGKITLAYSQGGRMNPKNHAIDF